MYMSPEQLDGDSNGQGYLGTAVDVWAAGVLLIVMLLGEHWPFAVSPWHLCLLRAARLLLRSDACML